jgi:hypothetical protein
MGRKVAASKAGLFHDEQEIGALGYFQDGHDHQPCWLMDGSINVHESLD